MFSVLPLSPRRNRSSSTNLLKSGRSLTLTTQQWTTFSHLNPCTFTYIQLCAKSRHDSGEVQSYILGEVCLNSFGPAIGPLYKLPIIETNNPRQRGEYLILARNCISCLLLLTQGGARQHGKSKWKSNSAHFVVDERQRQQEEARVPASSSLVALSDQTSSCKV